jgi:hypothetical protein
MCKERIIDLPEYYYAINFDISLKLVEIINSTFAIYIKKNWTLTLHSLQFHCHSKSFKCKTLTRSKLNENEVIGNLYLKSQK